MNQGKIIQVKVARARSSQIESLTDFYFGLLPGDCSFDSLLAAVGCMDNLQSACRGGMLKIR